VVRHVIAVLHVPRTQYAYGPQLSCRRDFPNSRLGLARHLFASLAVANQSLLTSNRVSAFPARKLKIGDLRLARKIRRPRAKIEKIAVAEMSEVFLQPRHAAQRPHCLAGHVRFEPAKSSASYLTEIPWQLCLK
jgi:hypothetical protein